MEVWSIVVWLNQPGIVSGSPEVRQSVETQRETGYRPTGFRKGIFNPPSLERVQYRDYASLEEAESALRDLQAQLAQNKPLLVSTRDGAFVIPSHSVHYLALGSGHAEQRGE